MRCVVIRPHEPLPEGLATTQEEARLIRRLLIGPLPHWAAAGYGVGALGDLVERGLAECRGASFVLTASAMIALGAGRGAEAQALADELHDELAREMAAEAAGRAS